MGILAWNTRRNIEDSLKEFLETTITTQSLTVFNKGGLAPVNVSIGFPERNQFELPLISVWCESKTQPRFLVGTNKREETWLVIMQIRSVDAGSRDDLAEWLSTTVNNGFPFFRYAPNLNDPDNPLKTASGRANVDFVSDNPIRLENVDDYDLFRHQISVNITLN